MKRLRRFDFYEPTSVQEAIGLLAAKGGGARVLAGGTDLLVDMKLGRARPTGVVNLKGIAGLDRIDRVDGGTRIGSLVRIRDIESSSLVQEKHHALWQACRVLGPRPVRNLATIGGNLGRASPASDTAPPLIVHGAVVLVEGPEGSRALPIEEFHLAPGSTHLAPCEIVTSVFLPDPAAGAGTAYRKLGKRGGGWDIALVGVAAGIALSAAGEVTETRIALGSVGPTPMRARAAEGELLGRAPTDEALGAAAQAAAEEISPISDQRASASYRKALSRVLTLRTLQEARALARQRGSLR